MILRRLGFTIVLILSAAPALLHGDGDSPQAIQKLIVSAERSGEHQAELYSKIARREVELARDDYNSGKLQEAVEAVNAAAHYAAQALESAHLHRAHLKAAEVNLRRSARGLEEIERGLELDQRPPVTSARQQVEQFDSELLQLMFSPPRHK